MEDHFMDFAMTPHKSIDDKSNKHDLSTSHSPNLASCDFFSNSHKLSGIGTQIHSKELKAKPELN